MRGLLDGLDMLQGNGHERDFMVDENVYIMDVYNSDIYPHDQQAKRTLSALYYSSHRVIVV